MEKDSLRKWLEGTMSEAEKNAFESTDEFKKLQKIIQSSQSFKAPEYDIEKELARINERKTAKGKVIKLIDYRILMRIAAIILLLVGVYWVFLRNSEEKISTLAGEKSEIYLPDSSMVIINAYSTLSFDRNRWQDIRRVELDGEAFFKVKKGSRFNVSTVDGLVTVLGTQFNVKQREGMFEVTCFEGLVKVENGDQVTELSKSQKLLIYKGKVLNGSEVSGVSPDWLVDKSEFHSLPFIEVIKELERQYGVEIELKNIDNDQLFSGGFPHDNLVTALKSVSMPLNATYEIKDKKHIMIIGEKY